jgi:eukaryotic-like serine/threonine-protein kinase
MPDHSWPSGARMFATSPSMGLPAQPAADLALARGEGPPLPWQAGTHFSRYEIDSRLASGGMAEVWRARIRGASGFQKRIVIKTMLTHLASRPDLVQMFVNEAAFAGALGHRNIAHVFDFGLIEGRHFIAMEYVPGVTLRFARKRMLARRERLPIATTLHVMADVCDALESVHGLTDAQGALGLIHRDLSPDNIIVSTSGSAKLIDFGAARATLRTPLPTSFVGKYRYAAPERIRREAEDARSDIYSAGVILYECLTGTRPFDGTDAELIRAVDSRRPCDPRLRDRALPASVAAMVMKAMAQRPEDRFASARELGVALRACLAKLGASSKERDVTAALAAVIETRAETPPPLLIAPATTAEPSAPTSDPRPADSSSDVDALCEVEIVEASGPIQTPEAAPTLPPIPPLPPRADGPLRAPLPPRPRAARPSAADWSRPGQLFDRVFGAAAKTAVPGMAAVLGWRTTNESPPAEDPPAALQRAMDLFDHGVELRVARRYGEALHAWERALALAPENLVYRSNVGRLRAQLDALRRAERDLAAWDTDR